MPMVEKERLVLTPKLYCNIFDLLKGVWICILKLDFMSFKKVDYLPFNKKIKEKLKQY